MGEPSEKDGSFSVPAEQPTRHFTDAEVRRNYEYILTSTNLYPPELHSAVRSVLSEPPLNPDWSDKGRQIAALFTPYGDREYGTYWRLLERLTSGTTARFQFAKNIYSTYNQRVHFSPVWFPDGSYTVNTHVMDIWTPAGMLAMNLTDDVTISGSLYDDWHIAPGNP